jgi:hypothetical protein
MFSISVSGWQCNGKVYKNKKSVSICVKLASAVGTGCSCVVKYVTGKTNNSISFQQRMKAVTEKFIYDLSTALEMTWGR